MDTYASASSAVARLTSFKDLIAAIQTYIDAWNERCQPFTWTKTADEILIKQQAAKDHHSPDTSWS
jgi:hypothetical protein